MNINVNYKNVYETRIEICKMITKVTEVLKRILGMYKVYK